LETIYILILILQIFSVASTTLPIGNVAPFSEASTTLPIGNVAPFREVSQKTFAIAYVKLPESKLKARYFHTNGNVTGAQFIHTSVNYFFSLSFSLSAGCSI
jgi:hypothetical protein